LDLTETKGWRKLRNEKLLTKYHDGDNIEDKMGGTCNTNGAIRNTKF